MQFLRELARDVVEQARVKPGTSVGRSPANTCGFTLIMPGGRGGYPAFWIRDFSMSLDSGFITPDEMLDHLRLIARCQNGVVPRLLKNGLLIPPFAIPDHINFDGSPAFYPGTYSSGEDQGTGAYGIMPPVDDHYEFVHIAYCLLRRGGKPDFLGESINGLTLLARLLAAFNAPTLDAKTGLVATHDGGRAVGFGFCDAIYLTGSMLFPSLLRYRAAGELAELCDAAGQPERILDCHGAQENIRHNLASTFSDPQRLEGWLMAATLVGRQPDVWGTLCALHLGLLDGADADRAAQSVLSAMRQGTITFEGAVRHVPSNFDASPTSAWERTSGVAINTYQNGAYWHTPTGWLLKVLQKQDPPLAGRLFTDYIQHLRKNDFRLGPGHDAPWECFGPNGYAQNGLYMTSVTLPWSVLGSP